MKYRSSISITLAILETIYEKKGANMTQISTHANVPHARLKVRLEELMESGLITGNPSNRGRRKTYVLTEKGWKAYLKLRELAPFLSSLGLMPKETP
ncbi:MAG: winged helix-turn-helix domain-containing protein [Candidatus Geothermarchaeales archaeon]